MGRVKFDVTIGAFGRYPTVEAKGSAEYPNEFRDFIRNIYSTLGHEILKDTETKKAPEMDAKELNDMAERYLAKFHRGLSDAVDRGALVSAITIRRLKVLAMRLAYGLVNELAFPASLPTPDVDVDEATSDVEA